MNDIWLQKTQSDKSAPPDEQQWRTIESGHWWMLKLCVFIVIMAGLLEVRPDQRVQFRFAPNWPLPETCGSKILFQQECPGCGLTRSFVYLFRGRMTEAWRLNHMSLLVAGAALAQFPYRAWAIADLHDRRHRGLPPPTRRWPMIIGWLLIAGLIGAWVLKLVGM